MEELEERVRESLEKIERGIEARMRELKLKRREMEKEKSENARRLGREAEEWLGYLLSLFVATFKQWRKGRTSPNAHLPNRCPPEQRAEAEKQLRESREHGHARSKSCGYLRRPQISQISTDRHGRVHLCNLRTESKRVTSCGGSQQGPFWICTGQVSSHR